MTGTTRYRTRQRRLVVDCLQEHAGRYLTVDETLSLISAGGESIGRTTVYRALEAMAAEGTALKAAVPGGEASYRIAEEGAAGQLVCLKCGSVFPLDCDMASDFSGHVLEHHGFHVDSARTVLYGCCRACMEAADER